MKATQFIDAFTLEVMEEIDRALGL